ncbi:multidrug ABC transporter [Olsenella sp. SW781]|uniref:multidrug ABC transporter n=1 Tax=Olsenella sp. SW781 TaxID=2530046 RepID=UPI00143A7701|nr:multidrug ABC transporter [Olsenella sp. SW781]NJE80123.1 multidrug ABC transporter [Olsenella sp. SW781]
MDATTLAFAGVNLLGVLVSAVSQVLLKKSAMREHESAIREYLNPFVIFAYVLFVGSTLLSVISYRGIPLSMGPILEATGYLYVTIFGVTIFHERMNRRKLVALALIICGIVIYSTGL